MLQLEKLKLFAQQSAGKIALFRYHKISNNIANTTLKEIEKEKGTFSVNSKKIADEYAIDILGWKGYAPWLYVYSHISGEFKEGWMPDNFYGKVVIPKIQGDYGKISFLKPLTNQLFEKEISPDIASFINGFWFEKNRIGIPSEIVEEKIFDTTDKVVFKLDQSYQGKGVFMLNKKDFNLNFFNEKGNGVVQKYIEQHPFFDEFSSDSVATIRMTTVVDASNKVSLRACYLRLGRNNDTHVKSINHIRIPINIKNGALYEEGYLANWKLIDKHPDSKTYFLNKTIPNYKGCLALVLQLHEKMLMVRSIGWDIVVDKDDNPIVMEWNGYSNDIKFSEATQGPCFGDLDWSKLRM